MKKHTTHFDDCGCLSARFLKREKKLLAMAVEMLVGRMYAHSSDKWIEREQRKKAKKWLLSKLGDGQ